MREITIEVIRLSLDEALAAASNAKLSVVCGSLILALSLELISVSLLLLELKSSKKSIWL
jgi:hypothetical protein